MGTNYYLHDANNPHSEDYHIGKSSGGWCFGLHVDPDKGVNDLKDLKEILGCPYLSIRNEYGEKVSRKEMLEIITEREGKPWEEQKWEVDPKYGFGYASEAAFHEANHSERGPNGLARHKIDGVHCVGHGEGTWDLIAGDFS